MSFLGLSMEHPVCEKSQGSTETPGAESLLVSGMLVVKPLTSCQGCDPAEAKFGLSAPVFVFLGGSLAVSHGKISTGVRLSSAGWPWPGQGAGEGRGRFQCHG